MRFIGLALALGWVVIESTASGQTPYRDPPPPIGDILAVPPVPSLSLAPTEDRVALISSDRYPPIKELAEPMLRLAGLRINPVTNGPARQRHTTGVTFIDFATRTSRPLVVPKDQPLEGLHGLSWAPDGVQFLVMNDTPQGTQLWLGDATTGVVQLVPGVAINGVLGGADWTDSGTILALTVPLDRPAAPVPTATPAGPVVQESQGKAAPVRTYQDLLQNSDDEKLFAHLVTSQLTAIDATTRVATRLSMPDFFLGASASPDGKYLLTRRLKPPFSYLYGYNSFPQVVEVRDRQGTVVLTVADLPLQDRVPIEGVPTGPRRVRWLPTEPATLTYAEARDDGDPRKKVEFRDELFTWAAPFTAPPVGVFKTPHRFTGVNFLENGLAMVADYDRERKWSQTVQVDFKNPDAPKAVVFDRSTQDRYGDPGRPLGKTLANGQQVLKTYDGKLVLSSGGATPQGDRPFLSHYDIATQRNENFFVSRDGYYETAVPLNDAGTKLLVRRESPSEPGNWYLRDGETEVALTQFPDPYPPLREVKKQLVTTKRPDGVTISFTLYTPAGYKEGTPLPTVFWAYPREFASADDAGQVSGSPNRFVTLSGYSHLFFLTQGYAVMDEVSIPIVGPPETANDTFVEQLRSSAKAAIDKASEMGVVDRTRIGVGGHSYGAFMTANLLAHTDLFRAGIARSGAYNRTLTPFGFQNERRTFWEAPEIYAKMSPFNNVTKINEPLLLIHGQADSNPGTFPVQSERMYQALRGVGGHVRLVLLPHEDHGYQANESIRHVLAESVAWFDEHVKNAKPAGTGGTE